MPLEISMHIRHGFHWLRIHVKIDYERNDFTIAIKDPFGGDLDSRLISAGTGRSEEEVAAADDLLLRDQVTEVITAQVKRLFAIHNPPQPGITTVAEPKRNYRLDTIYCQRQRG